ncbi:pirin family protein [Cohnella sp. GCM10027633]|uniref:pirin family protein n=1 Tax=unclassified Cohnella TaxID=2636738 RepID=UPI00362775BB
MTYRTIEGTYRGAPFHMVGDGFRVSNYFPSGNDLGERFSPFLLLDYNAPYDFGPSHAVRGVGAHPHRGFETVSIAYEGYVEHHDNYGNHGIVGPGDVQWMTAGSGLLHKEYHEKEFAKRGGTFHFIQLWVNLPRAYKMHSPRYQELPKASMGRVALPDGGGKARIIAGDYDGTRGPAETFSPINLFDLTLKARGVARFSLPASHNAGLIVLRGSAEINESRVAEEGEFVLFGNVAGDIRVEGLSDDALVLVLSGEPLGEPVFQYGPFVMNTREEVIQAYADFQAGKMGKPNF